jgi:hypothetical protein
MDLESVGIKNGIEGGKVPYAVVRMRLLRREMQMWTDSNLLNTM